MGDYGWVDVYCYFSIIRCFQLLGVEYLFQFIVQFLRCVGCGIGFGGGGESEWLYSLLC